MEGGFVSKTNSLYSNIGIKTLATKCFLLNVLISFVYVLFIFF